MKNLYEEVCDYQDKLDKGKILVCLWLLENDTDVQMLKWERNNIVCQEIGIDDGYIPNLFIFDTSTNEIKKVWTYQNGWLYEK